MLKLRQSSGNWTAHFSGDSTDGLMVCEGHNQDTGRPEGNQKSYLHEDSRSPWKNGKEICGTHGQGSDTELSNSAQIREAKPARPDCDPGAFWVFQEGREHGLRSPGWWCWGSCSGAATDVFDVALDCVP